MRSHVSRVNVKRCPWLPAGRPLYEEYHDTEWGVPSRDPRYLFEMLCLEGAQSGLSWWTVLQKRQRYREVFHNFDPEKMAEMGDSELEALLQDPGVIRHRGKVFAFRQNARAWLAIEKPVDFLWSFTRMVTIHHSFRSLHDYPSASPESTALSKALRLKGFNFVGPTCIYAFMQAVGMVEDHSVDCFRKGVCAKKTELWKTG